MLDFKRDLPRLAAAAALSSSAILAEIDALDTAVKDSGGFQSDFVDAAPLLSECNMADLPFSSFVHVATSRLLALRSQLTLFNKCFCELLRYFGENDQSSGSFFSNLNQFGASFQLAVDEVSCS